MLVLEELLSLHTPHLQLLQRYSYFEATLDACIVRGLSHDLDTSHRQEISFLKVTNGKYGVNTAG